MSRIRSVVSDGVWKRFRRSRRDDTLRDVLPGLARAALRRRRHSSMETFWALRDVSFEVVPGRVLGIIGSNGAGKSTVLKLLTGVMEPTRGRIVAGGRIGALIEVAAGFHPDLSGRENVFLQGAIMGMRRREILEKFDRIVDFAGVGTFIDTPVKRYSSGMSARLGFAIAAHLDPDVLLIDEVLSVGDHAFQRRAFAHLREVVDTGVPVVVVSHHLERIVEFADDAMLLVDGAVARYGRPEDCVQAYVDADHPASEEATRSPYAIEDFSIEEQGPIRAGTNVGMTVAVRATGLGPPDSASIGVRVRAVPEERVVFATNTWACGVDLPAAGAFTLRVRLRMNVGPGLYRLQPVVWRRPEGSEWVRGDSRIVRIEPGRPPSYGPSYLDPGIELTSV